MKLLIAVCILVFVAVAYGTPTGESSRGCIYISGECVQECEKGTHAYSIGCGYIVPEATCDNPNPNQDTRGEICDYSACYCDAPTVRHSVSHECVPLSKCRHIF